MFQKIVLFFLIIILAAAQISLFPHFFRGAVPDILLLAVVIWVAKFGFEKIWLRLFISGMILDLLSASVPGLNALSFLVVAYGTGFLAKRFLTGQGGGIFLFIGALSIFGTIINYLILFTFTFLPSYVFQNSMAVLANGFFLKNLGLKIIFNLILFPIVYWILKKTDSLTQIPEKNLLVNY